MNLQTENSGLIRIHIPSDIESIINTTEDDVKRYSAVFDYYRTKGNIEEIYGKNHWKNPFEVVVPAEDKDMLCFSINWFLADYPYVKPYDNGKYFLVKTNGYQG